MGGWKKEGGGKPHPKKWFCTSLFGTFSTFLGCRCSLFFVKKWKTDQTRRSFRGVQKFSGGCVVRYVFLTPYVLQLPMSWPNYVEITRGNAFGGGTFRSLLQDTWNFSEVAPEVRPVVYTALLCGLVSRQEFVVGARDSFTPRSKNILPDSCESIRRFVQIA